jgi:sec-independent protein translocase protein TatA
MFSGLTTPGHLLLLLAVVVLLFGAKKLPELARGVGKSARILKAEVSEMNNEGRDPEGRDTEAKPTPELPEGSTKRAPQADKLPDSGDRA